MTFKTEPRRPATVWILVADRAQARVFAATWPALEEFVEVADLVHPESSLRPSEAEVQEVGQFRTHSGRAVSGQPATDFRHKTAIEFAQTVVEFLEQGRNGHQFGRLVVIAPALFLGVLREKTPDALKKLVECEMDQELVSLEPRELRDRVIAALRTPSA